MELRALVPCIILAGLLSEVGLRFVPPSRVAFRAWEAAILFATGDGPYPPNLIYRNERSYGDLANLGNLPSHRKYRREVFTTNASGFRNTLTDDKPPIGMIVVGDSFAGGAGLSDADTLSSQLARLGRAGVYDGGTDANWRTVDTLVQQLNLRDGWVIWQQSERFDVPSPIGNPQEQGHVVVRVLRRLLGADSPSYRRLRWAKRTVDGWVRYSPLKIWLTRGFRSFQDDVWLPNVAARNVVVEQLANGQQMLFLASEAGNFGKTRAAEPDFFVQLQSHLKPTGNQLLVLLVPDKYNVYYPLLRDGAGFAADERSFLSSLARNLRRAGVPVVDLTPVFREQAAAALADGEYNYLLDDTHWNPLGVRRAAHEVLEFRRR